VFAEFGLSDAEIDRYVVSSALVSVSLPKAANANKRQLVSAPVTDTRQHTDHET
jgi:hypothetical protein